MKQTTRIAFLIVLLTYTSLQAAAQHGTLRIMTYNVHHCNPPGQKGVIDVDAVAEIIKNAQADLVAVQEVDVYTRRSGNMNQARLLAAGAGYPFYFFGKAIGYDGGDYGVLILSKYPMSDTMVHRLPQSHAATNEPRILAEATIVLPDKRRIRFGSTHLEAYDQPSRLMQAAEIQRIAGVSSLPFILAGDLNDVVDSEVLRQLAQSFSLTCTVCPSTFPGYGENGAIDYIASYPADAFSVLSHQVLPEYTASDHLPVVADLQLKE